jgi:hypothetical protein
MPQPSDFGYFRIALRGVENEYPALSDVSSFWYDFNLLYEFSRVVVDQKYGRVKLSRFSGYRNRKQLFPEDRLEVDSLRIESAIELITILGAGPSAAATLWVLTQAFERITNFSLNREILKLQRDNLKRELLQAAPSSAEPELPENDAGFREQLHVREADKYVRRVERRLEESPVHVEEIEITHVRELPAKRKE